MNHAYFNTKKGFYWSDKNHEQLVQGIIAYDLDAAAIRENIFKNGKSEMELELRMCLLFGVNDLKKIVEKDLKEFKKSHQSNGNAAKK